jgi:hypothetical protein
MSFSYSQFKAMDTFFIDLNESSTPAFSQLDNILLRDNKNIFLLSESNHPDLNLSKIRYLLSGHLGGLKNIQRIIYEFPFAGSSLLNAYLSGKIKPTMLHDSVYSIGYNDEDVSENSRGLKNVADYIDAEFDFYIKKSTLLDEFTFYKQKGLQDRIIPIDIGLHTQFLEKGYLVWITKLNCSNRYIQAVCDSIVKHSSGEFQYHYFFRDSKQTFDRKLKIRKEFLDSLIHYCSDKMLHFAWQNAFAGYIFSQRSNLKSILDPEQRPLTTLEFMEENSFRDSILFENFKWAMPDSFENVLVSFSTLHLMDTRQTEGFKDVMTSNTKTLGRYLHSDTLYSKYLKRIAFICDDTHRKDGKFIKINAKQSLEFALSKKFNLAYVDLEGYRNSVPKSMRKPFYMRPTFWSYRNLNWEEIFDGIVFVKDCGCSK